MLDDSRLGNNIKPATEGSDVVKAGGSGLEVNEGGITHSKHTEGVVPIIDCGDYIVRTKCGFRENRSSKPTRQLESSSLHQI